MATGVLLPAVVIKYMIKWRVHSFWYNAPGHAVTYYSSCIGNMEHENKKITRPLFHYNSIQSKNCYELLRTDR